MTQNERKILYDEEGDYYYIEPRPSDTDDWTFPDIVEGPADWVLYEDIPFDESDYDELEKRIESDNNDGELVIKKFIQEKGIEDILRQKGMTYYL